MFLERLDDTQLKARLKKMVTGVHLGAHAR